MPLDTTNDPGCRSWLQSANRAGTDFPIQNLPLAIFRRRGSDETLRGGIAIGDEVLDLALLASAGGFGHEAGTALSAASRPALNDLMAFGPPAWAALRNAVFEGLLEGARLEPVFKRCLVPQSLVEYALPARIGDFT